MGIFAHKKHFIHTITVSMLIFVFLTIQFYKKTSERGKIMKV